ncbi:MAG TPA: hypothetical protein PKN52_06960 [Trueperaceae bacterium]|nr:hypothetical protein [Trueperaceae bacterium]
MPEPNLNAARRKAEAMGRQAAQLGQRVAETKAAQEARLAELQAAQKANLDQMVANQAEAVAAMVAAQSTRMDELATRTGDLEGMAGEIASLLTAPPEPPPPVRDLFLEPFNEQSAHRARIPPDVEYGIPPGTLNAKVAKPVYDAGKKGERGRLALVRTFRCGATGQGRKYLIKVSPNDPPRRVVWHKAGGSGDGLPITVRMPAFRPGLYPTGDGDNSVLLYDPAADRVYQFNQFSYGTTEATARACFSYPLSGRDVRNRWDDPGMWGPGAIDWRHPGGFLRGREVDLTGAVQIRHVLNATATRHSGAGATAAQHALSKRMAYPAWETDRPLDANDNLGDLPYGTIVAIRRQDAGLRETLGLSPFGKRLFDTLLAGEGYGCCIGDGQGQIVDNAPVLQLRVDSELAENAAKVRAVDEALAKLLPHLWPVFTTRRHDA